MKNGARLDFASNATLGETSGLDGGRAKETFVEFVMTSVSVCDSLVNINCTVPFRGGAGKV